jgi:hypothetical protein
MGLSLAGYANCTQLEFDLKVKGFKERELIGWKQTRQIAYTQMMSMSDPQKTKGMTAEQWWPLEPKEVVNTVPIYKRKDFKALVQKFKHVKR